jgi:D-methionine transport system substrate-binding protein
MKKLNYAFAILAFSLVSIVACNNREKKENILKVGVVSGPEKELAETAKKVAKEKFNLDVELVAFNDYVVPNEALNQVISM